ncbi:HAD family phosphatase [Firmicutes bacterium AM41-11]|nr:HAD family phosphatase [Firmicutes bacterium AM41-11]
MQTIFFDMDDTLIESMYVWEDAISDLFQHLGIDTDFNRMKKTFMSYRFSEVLVYIRKYFGAKMSIEEMEEYTMKYIKNEYMYHVPEKPGALAFIQQCAKKQIPMAIVTSNDETLSKLVLDRLGMLPYISHIFSAEQMSLTKRKPEIYQIALDTLDANPETTTVFEDSMYAIQTASSLGIHCVGLVNDWNRKEFAEHQVDIIPDFRSLIEK